MQHHEQNSGGLGDMMLGGLVGFAVGIAFNPARKLATQALEAMKGDWFEIIKAEHDAVEELLHALVRTEDGESGKRQALLSEIAFALNKHAVTEENVVYPALRRIDEPGARELGAEHLDIKALISNLQYDIDKSDPSWLQTAKRLRDLVISHAQEEENEILEALHRNLSDEGNASLTRRLNWEGLKLA